MTEIMLVEVAYATPEKQKILEVEVPVPCTLFQAAELSGIVQEFPEIDLESSVMGVFGKRSAKPKEQTLNPGDRVEIYRPLLIDPKQARANRAAKKQAEQQQQ